MHTRLTSGHCVQKKAKIWILIFCCVNIAIYLIMYLIKDGGYKITMSDIVLNIGINVVSAVITSVLATIFIYYKFLRKIPEMTEKKIDDMLNARLNYETANHNAVLQALNLDNKYLSGEHKDLHRQIDRILERQIRMDAIREDVSDVVKPEAFVGMAESLIEKNGELNGSLMQAKIEMQSLTQELQLEREKIKQLESQMENLKNENMKLKQQYKGRTR